MSKYINLDEAIRVVADQYMFEATMDSPYASEDIKDYIGLGEKLLSDLPTIEVGEDTISRAGVLEIIDAMRKVCVSKIEKIVYSKVYSQIKDAPRLVADRPKGEA